MAQRVLMNALRDLLRLPVGLGTPADGLAFTEAQCETEFDGQPPPVCGEPFVAIHEGDWRQGQTECMDEYIGVLVTVTRRVAFVPRDRGRVPLLDATDALHRIAERIKAKVHNNYAILDMCGGSYGAGTWTGGKAYSFASTVQGFVEPLRWRGFQGPTQIKGPDWFSSPEDSEGVLGVARTLVFADARRVQDIDVQT